MKCFGVALLGATLAAAELHAHNHAHLHAKRASPVEAREAVTQVVNDPLVTVYVFNGKDIPFNEVEEGLKDGKYILVPPATTSTAPYSTATPHEFFQKTTTSPTTTSTPKPKPKPTHVAAPAPASSPVGGGIDAHFPSGTIPCHEFPSQYGAIEVPYLGLGGYIGVQNVPDYSFGIDEAISYIVTAIAGSSCTPKSFCSYACPPGYQKSQWPVSQGATGQSIGGVYCNSNGMLELSNPSSPTLCISGTGGVQVTSSLSQNVCICRTDYPGTESETVPLDVLPGGTYPLTCPDAETYYKWEGAATSAQYYLNPAGAPCSEACTWNTPGSNLGNYSPTNLGVGKGTDGNTYVSLFQNRPSNDNGKLNYNIKISGATGSCAYVGGQYLSNGTPSESGCTVSPIKAVAVFRQILTVLQVAAEAGGLTFEFYD